MKAVKQDWWWSRRVWLRVDDAAWCATRDASDVAVFMATQAELDDALEARVSLEVGQGL